MARQPRTRQPKTKFKKRCSICLAEKVLVETAAGLRFACSANPSHTPLNQVR